MGIKKYIGLDTLAIFIGIPLAFGSYMYYSYSTGGDAVGHSALQRVIDKAKGEDRIFDREEKIKLALDLGYPEPIDSEKPIDFGVTTLDGRIYIRQGVDAPGEPGGVDWRQEKRFSVSLDNIRDYLRE